MKDAIPEQEQEEAALDDISVTEEWMVEAASAVHGVSVGLTLL